MGKAHAPINHVTGLHRTGGNNTSAASAVARVVTSAPDFGCQGSVARGYCVGVHGSRRLERHLDGRHPAISYKHLLLRTHD